MNEKTFKKWLIGISIFAGIAVLYFLIYMIVWLSTPYTMEGFLVDVQPYAIAWLALAVIAYGVLILVSYRLEKKHVEKQKKKEKDQELLKQYVSKKK